MTCRPKFVDLEIEKVIIESSSCSHLASVYDLQPLFIFPSLC